MRAAEIERGQFPEHVGHIKIKPATVPSSKKDHFVCGRCRQTDQGGSEVQIFAGSIKETVNSYLVDLRATNVALHEFGHSLRGKEVQVGAWLDKKPSEAWEETDAETYVKDAHHRYQERNTKGNRRTWLGLFASRNSEKPQE